MSDANGAGSHLEKDLEKDFEKIQKAVVESTARSARQIFTFIVTILYILITVASISNFQLFFGDIGIDNIKLPIIDIELHPIGFFFIAPILVFALHFHTLLNLFDHTRKLHAWQKIATFRDRVLLSGFIFNYIYVFEKNTLIKRLMHLSQLIIICIAPLFTLVYIQIRFVVFHINYFPIWNLFLIIIDIFLLIIFWFRIVYPEYSDKRYDSIKNFLSSTLLQKHKKTIFVGYIPMFLLVFLISVSNLIPQIRKLYSPLDFSGHSFVKTPPSDTIIQLYLKQGKTIEQAWLDHAIGVDLRGYDLSYANFNNCDLRNAKLDKTILNNASFIGANLTNAQMKFGTQLNNANLFGANLTNANIHEAELKHADLMFADLSGTSLYHTRLDSAKMFRAKLNGAQLYNAKLYGANLMSADLNGANLEKAVLDSVDLRGAKLNGTNLKKTELTRITVDSNTYFNGSYLKNTLLCDINGFDYLSIDSSLNGLLVEDTLLRGSQWDWDALIKDSIKTKSKSRRRKYIANTKRTRLLCESDTSEISMEHFVSDSIKFLAVRKGLVCQDSWTTQGLLMQKFPGAENVRNELLIELRDNCPEILKKIHNRLKITAQQDDMKRVSDSILKQIDKFVIDNSL